MLLANTQQIREADRIMIHENHFPGILLMETAGRRTTEEILGLYPQISHFLILAGPGNNGGDGLVIARYLRLAGRQVSVVLSHSPEKHQGDALLNYQALSGSAVPLYQWGKPNTEQHLSNLPENTLLIDALLGTGISSSLREPIAGMIAFFREKGWDCVAIDLPSGLSADTGYLLNTCIPAQYTFTFQLPKLCHYVTPAANFCGEVRVIDIGIWPQIMPQLGIQREVTDRAYIARHYKNRQSDSHKGTYGHCLTIAGSAEMAGAAALASRASLFMGAGLSTAWVPPGAKEAFYRSDSPEVMCRTYQQGHSDYFSREAVDETLAQIEGKSALILGPGMGQAEETASFLEGILPQIKIPLVMDADALNLISAHSHLQKLLPANSILTPHPGEMKRLSGRDDVQEHRIEIAESLAQKWGVIVILKGVGTLIALPNGQTWINPTGNNGMSTAGSGDVLAGTIGGLLAQGYSPEQAAIFGVYLHGAAGDRYVASHGPEGLTAVKLMEELSPCLKEIIESTSANQQLV